MIKVFSIILLVMMGVGAGYWFGQHHPEQKALDTASVTPVKKPLFYRHPMNPQVTSEVPAKDEMGMDYIAVFAETVSAPEQQKPPAGQVQLSPEKIQKLGVKTALVTERSLQRTLRILGTIQVDESKIYTVALKFEGWIQKLAVNTTGQSVKMGQALFEVYSPELFISQQEYLVARKGVKALSKGSAQALKTATDLTDNALQRLRYWSIDPTQIKRLETAEKPLETLPILSPVNGVVLEKMAQEGQRFMPGDALFRLADLRTVWLVAEVFELDLAGVKVGQSVKVAINAYPEQSFTGRVNFIYPTVTSETRTIKIRVALANTGGLLKPGLYGSVILDTHPQQAQGLAVPDSAVIDGGIHQHVLLSLGVGRFEPRLVKLGVLADGYYPVLEGLAVGDEVVTQANFLLDAESNLKAALSSMTAPPKPDESAPSKTPLPVE